VPGPSDKLLFYICRDSADTKLLKQWEQIFKDPMTAAAAIDRLVHHSVILELNIESYRMEVAKKNKSKIP